LTAAIFAIVTFKEFSMPQGSNSKKMLKLNGWEFLIFSSISSFD